MVVSLIASQIGVLSEKGLTILTGGGFGLGFTMTIVLLARDPSAACPPFCHFECILIIWAEREIEGVGCLV